MRTLAAAFAKAREERRAALVAFLAAGDPDLATTAALARAVAGGGADVIELGIPFSDPLADGPIIQSAYARALENGVTVKRIFELLPALMQEPELPIVLMTAVNPILAYGAEAFCCDAARAGAAGLLVPDVLPEDAGELRQLAAACGLDTIFLVAPDTSDARLAAAARASTGFVYLISRRGVTGPQGRVGETLEAHVARARACASVPIAVGFGVTTVDDVRRVAAVADGVIVGSAFVQAANDARTKARACGATEVVAAAAAVDAKAAELRAGIRRPRSQGERTER